MSAARHVLLLLLLALLGSGCASPDDPAGLLDDYNERLARVLERSVPARAPTRVPAWPAARDLQMTPADVRVGLRTFLEFDRCGLLQQISERNSSLGKLQPSSQRLLYELRLLDGLQRCVDLTAGDLLSDDERRREFAAVVRETLATKAADLPQVYWNATFGAAEFREFLGVTATPLQPGEQAPAGAVEAIVFLSTLGPGRPLPGVDELERHYQQLVGNRLGARLWLGMDLAARELDRGSSLLEQQAADGGLCPAGRPTPRAQRLYGVFESQYLARIQPWLALHAREGRALAGAMEKLWQAQQATPPAAMVDYRRQAFAGAQSLPEIFTSATRRHALAWRAVLAPCGLAPR